MDLKYQEDKFMNILTHSNSNMLYVLGSRTCRPLDLPWQLCCHRPTSRGTTVCTRTLSHTLSVQGLVCAERRAEGVRRPNEQELSAGALGAAGARPPYLYIVKCIVCFIYYVRYKCLNKAKVHKHTIISLKSQPFLPRNTSILRKNTYFCHCFVVPIMVVRFV